MLDSFARSPSAHVQRNYLIELVDSREQLSRQTRISRGGDVRLLVVEKEGLPRIGDRQLVKKAPVVDGGVLSVANTPCWEGANNVGTKSENVHDVRHAIAFLHSC